jgi:hypothetical protein
LKKTGLNPAFSIVEELKDEVEIIEIARFILNHATVKLQ